MATQKEVKNRIASIKNINKITRAMEMVAAARLATRRAADRRPAPLRSGDAQADPSRRRAGRGDAAGAGPRRARAGAPGRIVLISGDRGLAGAFNTNIIREGMRLRRGLGEEGIEVSFSAVGRKGVSALHFRKQDLHSSYVGFTDRPAFANAREIGEELTARYVDEELDRVELVYNRYVSPLTQNVWTQTLLPLQGAEVIGEGAAEEEDAEEPTAAEAAQSRSLWIYEPEPEELLAELIPEYVNISVYRALLESAASELGARMTAMRNAAENAETMMEELTLEMNRVRQAEITQEILEVVAGAEALG